MQDGHIASTSNTLVLLSYIEEENHFKGNFNVTGLFLGEKKNNMKIMQ